MDLADFIKPKLYMSKKKIIVAKMIRNINENFCAAPFCKRAERKAIPKSSLLADIYSLRPINTQKAL